jgi:hypothetical protein
MHVMVVVMMVVVVVMMVGHRSGRRHIGRRSAGRRRRGGFLGDGVSRQANGEKGGAYETLDHGKVSCCRKDPAGLQAPLSRNAPEPGMNPRECWPQPLETPIVANLLRRLLGAREPSCTIPAIRAV